MRELLHTTIVGEPPYKFILIVGNKQESEVYAIGEIYDLCKKGSISCVILGNGKRAVDVLKELSILQDKIASDGVICVFTHGGRDKGIHMSSFGSGLVKTEAVLRKIQAVIGGPSKSKGILVAYYACYIGSALPHIPSDMLTLLGGPAGNVTAGNHITASIRRICYAKKKARPRAEIIAKELKKNPENKIVHYHTEEIEATYKFMWDFNRVRTIEKGQKMIEEELAKYQREFSKVFELRNGYSLKFKALEYHSYMTESAYIAVREQCSAFFEAYPDMVTTMIFEYSLRYFYPQNQMFKSVLQYSQFPTGDLLTQMVIAKSKKMEDVLELLTKKLDEALAERMGEAAGTIPLALNHYIRSTLTHDSFVNLLMEHHSYMTPKEQAKMLFVADKRGHHFTFNQFRNMLDNEETRAIYKTYIGMYTYTHAQHMIASLMSCVRKTPTRTESNINPLMESSQAHLCHYYNNTAHLNIFNQSLTVAAKNLYCAAQSHHYSI